MNRLEAAAIRHPLRVELLHALADGRSIELTDYAQRLELPLAQVEYHCGALVRAEAVELDAGTARITATGKELHRIAQRPERRQQPDRRRGQDRRRD